MRALEDYAARYAAPVFGGGGPDNATRYVIEGRIKDATRQEWQWAFEYLRAHPQLLDGPAKTDQQLADEAAQAQGVAMELSRLARRHYDRGEYDQAQELIGQAEELDPKNPRWTSITAIIAKAATRTTTPASGSADAPAQLTPLAQTDAEPSATADPAPTPMRRQPSEAAPTITAPGRDTAAQTTTGPQKPAAGPSETTAEPPEQVAAPRRTTPGSTPAPTPSGPDAASPAPPFRPEAGTQLTPSRATARLRANLDAVRTLRQLRRDQRAPNRQEQRVLAAWSGWGAVPQVFDRDRTEFAWARGQLAELLSPTELAAAERNTLNAHYTDLSLIGPIWSALGQLGFDHGRVLEPGCGSGNFIGAAPPGAQMVGVELEPITAAIAATLYPNAQILSESFAETKAASGSFDLVVGNVPFGQLALADRTHNPGKHSIHNHFIIKSLHLVAPGGLVAVLTSRYTLDATNPAARREMAQLADLVGAIRLPASAHQRTAATKVVTDLLFLRRREDDFEPAPVDWELTELTELPRFDSSRSAPGEPSRDAVGTARINRWFLANPEMVCGELGVGRGQFSDSELTVREADTTADPGQQLVEKLDLLVDRARQAELTHQPRTPELAKRAALVGRAADLTDGHIAAESGQEFTQVVKGAIQPLAVPKTQQRELSALLRLRDDVVELLEAEAATRDNTRHLDALRQRLNANYDAYHHTYGPINRFSWRASRRIDPTTGQPRQYRVNPPQGGFRADPHAPLVYALERFNDESGQASKATILSERVIAPRTPRLGADTPADAVAICMDTHGGIELAEIARLLGVDEDQARAQLGALVFEDPARNDRLIPAAEYLSGDVRNRLAVARAAADRAAENGDETLRATYEAGVAALEQVIPADLAPEDIVARLGAVWVDRRYVEQFLRETLDDSSLTVKHEFGTTWKVDGFSHGVAATSTWGTERMPAPKLAEYLLCQSPVVVHDTIEVPGRGDISRPNLAETAVAQAKGEELNDRFGDWLWEDPERAEYLTTLYNAKFNNLVVRKYDEVDLSLPGLALDFTPRPHQIAAVARMIYEPAAGLWHCVGAGKTAEMAMGVMELRRLGLARKPTIVIPNHMIEQFGREFQQLYPRARLLAVSSADLTRERRRAFVARAATGDWDAVIMTRGAFERVPLDRDDQQRYYEAQLAELRDSLERAKADGERKTIKQMAGAVARAEERIKARLDREDIDPAVTFAKAGIDYLLVDEAHDFKNLATASRIPGAAIEGSRRASDLDMKLHFLRERHPEGRVVTFATATPIANSITEAHVMLRLLRPDLLEAAGVAHFDSWAATFGRTVSEVELSPDSSSFRLKSRFAKFHNVPELLRMWWVPGDVRTANDLQLPRPALAADPHGLRVPRNVVVPSTKQLADFIADIGRRAERIQQRMVSPAIDNMLKISSDGRLAALDMRLVGGTMPPGESKIEAVADEIAQRWQHYRQSRFIDPATDEAHSTPGALQLVFCDQSTPSAERWNAYDELRSQLVRRGLPAQAIRFIHEPRNDAEKARLFEACRNGQVAVLVGSTAKMGVGTNVQARAVALHHVDCPWRPADVEQRDGRILRQGNQNPEIEILRYVTEGSFDGYSWQTVARKARFVDQLMGGRMDVREIEDIGDSAMSFDQVKAIATGNPLLLDKAKADADLTRLERLERNHTNTRSRLRYTIESSQKRIFVLGRDAEQLEQAIAARRDTRGDRFSMGVDGVRFTERLEAGQTLRDRLAVTLARPGPPVTTLDAVASLGGHTFDARLTRVGGDRYYELFASGVPGCVVHGSLETLAQSKPSSLIVRMENRLAGLEGSLGTAREGVATCHMELARAEKQLLQPFAYAEELAVARERVAEIGRQLSALAAPPSQSEGESGADQSAAEPSEVSPGGLPRPPDPQVESPATADRSSGVAALSVVTPPPGQRPAVAKSLAPAPAPLPPGAQIRPPSQGRGPSR